MAATLMEDVDIRFNLGSTEFAPVVSSQSGFFILRFAEHVDVASRVQHASIHRKYLFARRFHRIERASLSAWCSDKVSPQGRVVPRFSA